MKILLAIDGSKHSSWAIDAARRLPLVRRPRLHIVHVIEKAVLTQPWIAPPLAPSFGNEAQRARAAAKRLTQRAAASVRGRGASVRTVVERGPVTDKILATARKEEADLIVMGSRGLSNVQRFLMGSVSQQVATYAPCSVLVVKQRSRARRRIVLAVDGSPYSARATAFLTAHLMPQHLDITVLNVRHGPFVPPARSAETIEERSCRSLTKAGFTARPLSLRGHAAAKIVEAATRQRADLVVVGSRGLTGLRQFLLGSVSRQVVKYSPASVLVVRSG